MFANKLAEMRTIKEVLTSAESLAHEMGDKEPGAEHLLLAAIDIEDGLARRAFEQIGADPDDFAMAIVRQHEAALAAAGIEVTHPSPRRTSPTHDKTPMSLGPVGAHGLSTRDQARQAVPAGGVRQRTRRGIAVAEQEHGTAARALAVMGIDRARCAQPRSLELRALAA